MRAPYLACIRPWAEALTSSQKMNKSINKLKDRFENFRSSSENSTERLLCEKKYMEEVKILGKGAPSQGVKGEQGGFEGKVPTVPAG